MAELLVYTWKLFAFPLSLMDTVLERWPNTVWWWWWRLRLIFWEPSCTYRSVAIIRSRIFSLSARADKYGVPAACIGQLISAYYIWTIACTVCACVHNMFHGNLHVCPLCCLPETSLALRCAGSIELSGILNVMIRMRWLSRFGDVWYER